MNASLVYMAAVLSAAPVADDTVSIYSPSDPAAVVVRGQVPTYQDPLAPPGTTTYPFPGTPAAPFGQPGVPFGQPAPGGAFGAPYQPGVIGADPCYPAPFAQDCPPQFMGAPAVCPPFAPGPTCMFFAGYESVFLRPYFSPGATVQFVPLAGTPVAVDTVDFGWRHEHSPRVWLGVIGPNGLGAQVRYWQFDHHRRTPYATPLDGVPLVVRQDLELHALDAEAVLLNQIGRGEILITGGVRYAKMEHTFGAVQADAAATPVAHAQRRFEGAGPTVSILGRRYFGYGNFALFANGRFSLVYGNGSDLGITYQPLPGGTVDYRGSFDEVIPITELQIGTEWWCMISPTCRFFLRTALEGQVWFDGGSGPLVQQNGVNDFTVFRQTGNLGLLGFTVGGGFTF